MVRERERLPFSKRDSNPTVVYRTGPSVPTVELPRIDFKIKKQNGHFDLGRCFFFNILAVIFKNFFF